MLVVVTHTLERTGSPISLLNLVKNRSIFSDCKLISYSDGPLKENFESLGIEVIIVKTKVKIFRLIQLIYFIHLLNPKNILINSAICFEAIIASKINKIRFAVYLREFETMLSRYKTISNLKIQMLRLSNIVICVSTANQEWINNKIDVKTVVIPNGISLPKEQEQGILTEKNGTDLLFVGTFDKRKGFDRLLRIIDYVNQHNFNKVNFHLYGDFPDKNSKEKFKNELENIKLNYPNVFTYGFVNELRYAYQSADAILLLSRQESLPRVVMEASSFGCPSVVYDVGGTRDLLPDSWEYCYDDDMQYLEGVIKIISINNEERNRLSNLVKIHIKNFELSQTQDRVYLALRNLQCRLH